MSEDSADPRLYPTFPLLGVSIALFRGKDILLIKRAKPPYQNYYSLPGGLVEAGELLEEAAKRELWEEVAMRCGPLTFNRHVELIERDEKLRVRRHYLVASFVGAWAEGHGEMNEEVSDIAWIPAAEISEALPITPGLMSILTAAQALMKPQQSVNPCR